MDNLLWAMEKQLVTAVVILDLSAAFNTVDHDLLLEVLEKRFGVTNKAKKWYSNYIKQRKFSVMIGKNKSESRQLKYSVPQGSIQGAFLFISYASMLDEIVKDLVLNGFVDDHSVSKTFKPEKLDHHQEQNTITVIEKSMLDIKSWMDAVRLKMNNSKTKFIYFGGSKQLEKCITNQINVNGEWILRSQVTRYLGAYLNTTLNLKQHIKIKCKAAMLNLLKIKAIRKYLTTEACTKAVITLVMSHLDYANSILNGLPKASICQLQRVQNMAANIVLQRNKFESSSKCLKELHWLPIHHRINFKVITLVFKCIHKLAPSYLEELIKPKKQSREGLRSEHRTQQLDVPRTTRHTFAARAFSIRGPTLWNQLPEHIKKIEDYSTFKMHLKTYYFRKAFP